MSLILTITETDGINFFKMDGDHTTIVARITLKQINRRQAALCIDASSDIQILRDKVLSKSNITATMVSAIKNYKGAKKSDSICDDK